MNETPYCFSLLMAQFAQSDSDGMWTIVGVFDRLSLAQFPVEIGIAVFFGLIDGRGEIPLSLKLVTADHDMDEHDMDEEEEHIAGYDFAVNLPNPLDAISEQCRVSCPLDARWGL